jgi:hypothetical protein
MGKNSADYRRDRHEPFNQPIKIYGVPDPERKPGPRGKVLRAELIELVRKIKRFQVIARRLGLFVEDRELLTCPSCGLQEDIAIDGRLLVAAPGNRGCDTGLRFNRVKTRGSWWRCPNCKTVLKEPESKR